MQIGGNDIIVPVARGTGDLTFSRLYELLSAIRLWWPDAQIEDAKKNCPLAPPLSIPCELHVHKDAGILELSDEKGVVPEVEPFFFSIYAQENEVTFVVGPEGSEGDRIVQDLRKLLREVKA